jgi:glutathione S-transferase
MLTVHHLRSSQSERIVWLCEELGIPYELKLYNRLPTMMGPPEYKALHPLGSAPIITDGDLALAETGAIIEYIVHKHGGGCLIPKPNEPGWTDYLYWFHVGNGTLLPALMRGMIMKFSGASADSPFAQTMEQRKEALIDMIEQRLSKADYFAGDALTAADIMNVFMLTTGNRFMPIDFSARPAIRRYVERIQARPAYQRAMAKAEPA